MRVWSTQLVWSLFIAYWSRVSQLHTQSMQTHPHIEYLAIRRVWHTGPRIRGHAYSMKTTWLEKRNTCRVYKSSTRFQSCVHPHKLKPRRRVRLHRERIECRRAWSIASAALPTWIYHNNNRSAIRVYYIIMTGQNILTSPPRKLRKKNILI